MPAIKFYMDEHIPRAVATGLQQRGYEVIMAVDVGMKEKDDDTEHLPFATSQNAVVFTRDKPFAGRTEKRVDFDHAGLICWTGKADDFGGMVRQLNKFASEHSPEEVRGRVFWIKA